MLGRLILLVLLLPVIEVVVLVWIGTRTSIWFVLGLVIAMGLVGALLLRYQSWQTLRRVTAELERGRMPSEPLVDGLFVLAAAVLLILPGVLSDLAAILLLLPPSRSLFKRLMRRRVKARLVRTYTAGEGSDDRERIIDVRVVENRPPGDGP